MWYLYLINIMNAALDNKGVILEYRIELAGMPINLLDAGLLLGVIYASLNVFMNSGRVRTGGVHRAQVATIVLFVIATLAGTVAATVNNAPLRPLITDLRNFLSFPLCMYLAYAVMDRPSSAKGFPRVIVVSGIAASALILLFFVGKSSTETKLDVEQIRAVQYVSSYAGWACALLLFIILGRHSGRMPVVISWLILGLCLLGQFATLSRSDWIPAIAAILTVPFLLPAEGRATRVLGFLAAIPVLIGVLFIGTTVISDITGRDLNEKMAKRITSMLPGQKEAETRGIKAWDTRFPAMMKELEIWLGSPAIGDGFAYHRVKGHEGAGVTYQHNVWSSALATAGIPGFLAYLVPLIAIIVVGRRMIRDSTDPAVIVMGALGVISSVYNIVQGMATMAFNVQRGAMAVGFIVGAVLRVRAMQLATQHDGYHEIDQNLAAMAEEYEYGHGRN